MTHEDLCYLPATEMLRLFRQKRLSPVEVMTAMIDRAERVEPTVNALSHCFFDEALDAARRSEARYLRGKRTRRLEGLPVAVKDETLLKGKPCTSGSLINKDFIAEKNSIENTRILNAGGIIHARTTTPEFSCAGYTHSKLWGVTRNPWNPDYTPGGSSGGAAASLASGTCALATGSDIGGSIRIPASCSGVVGFKPPYGRNASEPPFNLDTYCHTGPLARNVADAILLQNVVSGPHPEDIASIKPKLTLPDTYAPIQGWRIAYSPDLGIFEVEDDVRTNTLAALEVFRELGAMVEEVDLQWPGDVVSAGIDHLAHIFGVYINQHLEDQGELMTDYAREFARRGQRSTAKQYYHSIEVAGAMYARFGPIMADYNLFICPTNALAAVPAEHDQSRDTVTINGRTVDPLLGWVMTLPFNMLSRCPVLSMPTGKTRHNVPTGMQLVGASYRDRDVFRAAVAYENAIGPWYQSRATRPPADSVAASSAGDRGISFSDS